MNRLSEIPPFCQNPTYPADAPTQSHTQSLRSLVLLADSPAPTASWWYLEGRPIDSVTLAAAHKLAHCAMINYILLVSKQGKLRLAKWFMPLSSKAKAKIVQDVSQLALNRRPRMCNVLEYKGKKVVYRRYASLYFICEIGETDNELVALEVIQRYVEVLDKYFGNVCEMDLIFNFQKAYAILDELIMAGEMQETNSMTVLKMTKDSDAWEENDYIQNAIKEAYFA